MIPVIEKMISIFEADLLVFSQFVEFPWSMLFIRESSIWSFPHI